MTNFKLKGEQALAKLCLDNIEAVHTELVAFKGERVHIKSGTSVGFKKLNDRVRAIQPDKHRFWLQASEYTMWLSASLWIADGENRNYFSSDIWLGKIVDGHYVGDKVDDMQRFRDVLAMTEENLTNLKSQISELHSRADDLEDTIPRCLR